MKIFQPKYLIVSLILLFVSTSNPVSDYLESPAKRQRIETENDPYSDVPFSPERKHNCGFSIYESGSPTARILFSPSPKKPMTPAGLAGTPVGVKTPARYITTTETTKILNLFIFNLLKYEDSQSCCLFNFANFLFQIEDNKLQFRQLQNNGNLDKFKAMMNILWKFLDEKIFDTMLNDDEIESFKIQKLKRQMAVKNPNLDRLKKLFVNHLKAQLGTTAIDWSWIKDETDDSCTFDKEHPFGQYFLDDFFKNLYRLVLSKQNTKEYVTLSKYILA